jgi:hypothetical protein
MKKIIVTTFVLLVFSSVAFAQQFNPRDLTGIWVRTGGDRGFNNDVPPMTPEGQAKFDSYKPSYGRQLGSPEAAERTNEHIGRRRAIPPALGNDPTGECNPSGLTRILIFPRPMEIIQTQDRVLQVFQWTRALRDIWTDGRSLPTEPPLPAWYGYSVGKWEGDTFVVDSYGFDDRAWVDHFGYPLSDQLRLQERWRRTGPETLELEMTINDPKTYTRSWVSQKKTWTLQKRGAPSITFDGWHGMLEEICAPVDEVDQFNSRMRDPAVLK